MEDALLFTQSVCPERSQLLALKLIWCRQHVWLHPQGAGCKLALKATVVLYFVPSSLPARAKDLSSSWVDEICRLLCLSKWEHPVSVWYPEKWKWCGEWPVKSWPLCAWGYVGICAMFRYEPWEVLQTLDLSLKFCSEKSESSLQLHELSDDCQMRNEG